MEEKGELLGTLQFLSVLVWREGGRGREGGREGGKGGREGREGGREGREGGREGGIEGREGGRDREGERGRER